MFQLEIAIQRTYPILFWIKQEEFAKDHSNLMQQRDGYIRLNISS